MRHTRNPIRIVLAVALSLAAFLALSTAPATAAVITDRPLLKSFDGHYIYGPDGVVIGETDTTAKRFLYPTSIAIDQASGTVYVLDAYYVSSAKQWRVVVDKFNADGVAQPFSATGESSLGVLVGGSLGEPGVAVDNSGANLGRIHLLGGEVLGGGGGGSLSAFEPDGAFLWQLPMSSIASNGCAVALDGEGHVWVVDSSSSPARVLELASSGSPPAQIGSFPLTTPGIFPCSIDFDAAGNAYIAAHNAGGGVFKYIKNGSGQYEYSSTLDPEESEGVAVNRSATLPSPGSAGHLFTSHSGAATAYDASRFNEYTSSGALAGTFGKGVLSNPQGIAYDAALDRVYVANYSGAKVDAFGPEVTGTVPDVSSEAATEEEVSRAKLHGKINPQSVPNSWFFEWKPGIYADNWGAAQSSAPQSISPTDSLEHAVSVNANHLNGDTTYQARLVGLNTANRLRSVSTPVTFTTKTAAKAPALMIATPVALSGTTEEVKATVNPWEDFGTTWWLETSSDPACLSGFSSRPVHNLESEANAPVAVSEAITGLLPSEHYCVRIDAKNSFATAPPSEAKSFSTPAIPPDQVVTAFAAPRTDTSARLNAYVNPQGEALTYRFEYSTDGGETWIALKDHEDTSEARRAILVSATEMVEGQPVEELTKLTPNTTYSYRFSAENAADAGSSVQGGERTFTTRTSAEIAEVMPASCPNEEVRVNRRFAYLPQCRGIELVNNPDDGNQNVKAETGQETPPMSSDGEKAIWNVNGGSPDGNSGVGATFLARRTGPTQSAPNGWESKSLIPPAAQQIHAEDGSYHLEATTPNLTSFLFLPGAGSLFDETLVRLGDNESQEVLKSYGGVQTSGNSDLTDNGAHVLHIDVDSYTAHVSQDQLEDIGTPGHPEVVSYLPDGKTPECGVGDQGEGFTGSGGGAGRQWRPGYHRMAVTDASRVYFQIHPNGSNCGSTSSPWQIFERDREANAGKGETLQVAPPDTSNALIRATPDGRSVYFVSALSLDPADTNSHVDIYRWDEETKKDTCLTCGMENEAGEKITDANVREASPVMVSDDFSHVYFESTSKLTTQATPDQGNLYALSGGKVRFVADPNSEDALRYYGASAEVSSDGNVLVFRTTSGGNHQLTADRLAPSCSRPEGGSGPCDELFRYDDRDGSLECVSCVHGGVTTNSAGARAGGEDGSPSDFRVSADGSTVAFVTAQALAPHKLDINSGIDVYEWRAGAQQLITDGAGSFGQREGAAAQVLALSADGRDILLKVVDPGLTGFEQNRLANLYDARIGGGFIPPPPPKVCEVLSDTCQGPLLAAPALASPNSLTFSGPGDLIPQPVVKPTPKALTRAQKLAAALKACRKKAKGRRRAACERQARNRYGPLKKKPKARKASKAGRGRR